MISIVLIPIGQIPLKKIYLYVGTSHLFHWQTRKSTLQDADQGELLERLTN